MEISGNISIHVNAESQKHLTCLLAEVAAMLTASENDGIEIISVSASNFNAN